MVPVKSSKTCNYDQDLISNLPDIAIDKILKRLPIKTLAKMSVLSTKWRHIWLSLKYLVFDFEFWVELNDEDNDGSFASPASNCNWIISNILFHHVGPVHQFHLWAPCDYDYDDINVSGWISLLSKVGVKKIALLPKTDKYEPMHPSIFHCKDLVKLKLEGFTLNHTPSRFKGFAYLRSLELVSIDFNDDVFGSLIANCPQLRHLSILRLKQLIGRNNSLVIDAPVLEHLTIQGFFGSILFKNIWHLSFVSLHLDHLNDVAKAKGVEHSMEMLASSSQLRDLHFGGWMCKYFGASRISMPTLKFLQKLRLTEVNFSDFDEFCFTLGVVQCCPIMKDLIISVKPKKCYIEHECNYNKNCELRHLVKVEITGLTGSTPELKLIEYLFCVASKLEKLAFKCYQLDLKSELKVTQNLSEFPRASPKAKLVCLE